MRINQNVMAMNAYRNLAVNQGAVAKPLERLSSGLRINRAADDAAGLAISEGMRAQVSGANQGVQNTRDGINLLQTAEGNLNETHAILQRMRTLAVQAANETNSADELRAIQAEMVQSMADIDRIADHTEFNGMPLLDGTFANKLIQVGANTGDTKSITIGTLTAALQPAQEAATALWGLDDPTQMSQIPDPFVVEQTLSGTGETSSASVPLSPAPANATELAALLNADPTFSAAFTASVGDWNEPGKPDRPAVNLCITSKTPGAGGITVPGTSGLGTIRTRPGADEVPEQYAGYHAAELLDGPIDVTRAAGSQTTTITTSPSPGGIIQSGDIANATWTTVPPRPGGTTTTTTTWPSGASDAIARIDRAIARVSLGRAEMGATQNVLTHTERNVGIGAENLARSESRIRDADIAKEMTDMTRWQVLCQSGLSMLAQANKVPQSILSLLQ